VIRIKIGKEGFTSAKFRKEAMKKIFKIYYIKTKPKNKT